MASNGIQYVGGGGATVDGITVVSGGNITLTPPVNVKISSGSLDLNSQGSILKIGESGNNWALSGITLDGATSGGDRQIRINNTSPDANSGTILDLRTGGASAGDPRVSFRISGGQQVIMGLDNSASDRFGIADSSALGTNDRLRLVITTGVLTVDGDAGGSDDPVGLFDKYNDLELAERFAYSHPVASKIGMVT